MNDRKVFEATVDSIARESVLATLYARAEFWCMEELRYAGLGRHDKAEVAHVHAMGIIRAYELERENPIPDGLPERPAS